MFHVALFLFVDLILYPGRIINERHSIHNIDLLPE